MEIKQIAGTMRRPIIKYARHGLAVTAMLVLAACTTPAPPAGSLAPAPAAPSVEVYFYPTKGQTGEQQQRDRYECYLWARDQTGFDPSLPQLAPGQRILVEPAPSGDTAAAGAMAGAVFGAVTSRPGEEREGAVKGAIAGAIIGGMAEEARTREAQRKVQEEQAQYDAQLAQQANEYRRAMTACLEGRGYKVK